MPRLVGKQSSNGGVYLLLLLLAVVGIVTGLEHTGATNIVPGFGKDSPGESRISLGNSFQA